MDKHIEELNRRRGSITSFTSENSSRFCLNYAHLNVRSIAKHIDEITHFLSECDLQVFGVSETFLKRGMRSACYEINGYKIFRNDRDVGACGGVAFYIRKELKAKVIRRSNSGDRIEFILLELLLCGAKVLVGVFYIPPPTAKQDVDILHQVLVEFSSEYSHFIYMGDFNINLSDPTKSNYYLATLASLSLYPLPFKETRVSSTLDHILIAGCNSSRVKQFAQSPLPGISDHDVILLKYNHRIPKLPLKFEMTRDISKVDLVTLADNAKEIAWDKLLSMTNSNDQITYFSQSITDLFCKSVPLRKVLVKSPAVPWFNSHILSYIQKRDCAYAVWLADKNDSNRSEFRRLRNKVVLLIRDAKRKYFLNKFSNVQNSQQAWKMLKSLGYVNNSETNCSFHPNIMNQYFTSIPTTSPVLPMPCGLGYRDKEGAFSFCAVSEKEIAIAINSISSNAVGIDGISLTFIKLILPIILPYLTHVINFCIMSCHFPDKWKQALVIPIPKIPSPSSPSDYRPISILPVLSKVLEIIMRDQIQLFLDENNLLTEHQSGFRKNHSCATALSRVTYDVMQDLNSSKATILVLLDFTKAFDSISHTLIGQKLFFEYNFSAQSVRLILSYLTDRSQAVRADGLTSSLFPVLSGVPQGSILGPLLFSLFINQLPSAISFSRCHLYADDCQLYISGNLHDLSHSFRLLNEDLKNIAKWASNNGLILNPKKTQAILISRQHTKITMPRLFLNDVEISFSDVVRNLGVMINTNLDWSNHVNLICSKVNFALHSLRQLNFYTPVEIKKLLVRSLIIPFFTYGDILFFNPDYESSRRLQVAFNSCIRYIHNLRKYDHVSMHARSILGVPLFSYLKFRVCIFIWKLIYLRHPAYLSSLISFGSSPRTYNINSLSDRFSSRQFSSSMFVFGFNLWNSLPVEIKMLKSLSRFRSSCYAFFADQ